MKERKRERRRKERKKICPITRHWYYCYYL
jgi:hypothetical protein